MMHTLNRSDTLSFSAGTKSLSRPGLMHPAVALLARVAQVCRRRFEGSSRVLWAISMAIAVFGVSGVLQVEVASAAPAWQVDVSAAKRVSPGNRHTYLVTVKNVGDVASDGTGSLDISLPPGVTGVSAKNPFGIAPFDDLFTWSCAGIRREHRVSTVTWGLLLARVPLISSRSC